jgi:DNA topoisomerase I
MDREADTKATPADLVLDPIAAARVAGLRHVRDDRAGIRRKKRGKGFVFLDPAGKKITDPGEITRLQKIGIPPAWTDVWICPDPRGHIQATGRDARGRKQYRYHVRWREVRDETKYTKMLDFAAALPRIRQKTEDDLALPGLPRRKVLAAVVRLLEGTLIRVGNEEYARHNDSFGLTTLRDWHAKIDGPDVKFRFRGKSGKEHAVRIHDARLARIVKRCRDIPGDELFQYIDENGERHAIDSADVNEYLREIAGDEFTAKDFRTFAGTVLAALALSEIGAFDSDAQAKKNVVSAIKQVAERLGNTPAVCRRCYVHPALLDSYLDGSMLETLKARAEETMRNDLADLRPEEAAVVALLRSRLAQEIAERAPGGLVEKLSASVEKKRTRRPPAAPARRPARAAKSPRKAANVIRPRRKTAVT